eukprot:1359919-Rhodomonas_salina.1
MAPLEDKLGLMERCSPLPDSDFDAEEPLAEGARGSSDSFEREETGREEAKTPVGFLVVAAARNCEEWVRYGVESVLAQSYARWRMVLVDDASEDQTALAAMAAAKGDPRVQVIKVGCEEWTQVSSKTQKREMLWVAD